MTQKIKITPKSHVDETLTVLSAVPKKEGERISWDSARLDEGTFELIYGLEFRPSVDDHVKDGAIWSTLNECARKENFSCKFFIRTLRSNTENHLNKKKNLVAITQINCDSNVTLPSSIPSIFGSVKYFNHLPKLDHKIVQTFTDRHRRMIGLQDDFGYLLTLVEAPDDRSALDRAYRNIKYCLGVVNLITRGFGIYKRFGIPDAPIGKFLSASALFTIDRQNRKLGDYLTENHYPTVFTHHFSVRERIKSDLLVKEVNIYLRKLKKIDFSEKIIQAVILFQEGLESTHIDIALLKFWTAIEVLCARETKETSDKIVSRASSIFDNVKAAEMRLNFIQDFRNRIVHRGEAGGHAVLCAQMGSLYLATIIQFFLFNRYNLRTHAEILEYLSTPTEQGRLRQMISFYRRRLKIGASHTMG